MQKKNLTRYLVWAVLLAAALWLFLPRRIAGDPARCESVSLLFRAEGEETLRFYSPSPDGREVDTAALLALLHEYRAARMLFPDTLIDGAPSGEIKLAITFFEGGKEKTLYLGEFNRLDAESGTHYTVLQAPELLDRAIALLGLTGK